MGIVDRLIHAWDAFKGRDPTGIPKDIGFGYSSYSRPDRPRYTRGNERTMVAAVLNRIALDCAAIGIEHVRLDDQKRFLEDIDDSLNECLTVSANIDQTGRALLQDIVMSMLDEGVVAVVPTKSDFNPNLKDAFKIEELRTGKIVEWYPEYVKVNLYNSETGMREDILYRKASTAIIENPMYAVMNEHNSTLQRLMRKLSILDVIDEESGSNKLNLVVQLPYTVKTPAKIKIAEQRRKDLENQLKDNKYGIGYIDATEKLTQLNRPLENNLLTQIEFLTKQFFTQLGISEEIMNRTADENAMNNYFNGLIEPILSAITDEMIRKFLTKTARSQGQSIAFYRDIFKLMPLNGVAETTDKLIRNEVSTPNEIRSFIGLKPSKDPRADELRNPNISEAKNAINYDIDGNPVMDNQNEVEDIDAELAELDQADAELNQMEDMLHSGMDFTGNDEYLMHYASKYYDPVKAHEYYEEHKKLKGRNSVTLTDEGRSIAKSVKENINKEKTDTLKRSNEATKSIVDSNAAHLRNKVASLNKFLQQLSPKEREAQKERIQTMISSLRMRNETARKRLEEKKKNTNESIRSDYKQKYETELEKIKKEHGKSSGSGSAGGKVTRYVKRNWKS